MKNEKVKKSPLNEDSSLQKKIANRQSHSRCVLFVCTGNMCRSPMAEYLLRHHLGADSLWTVCSAGLFAVNGASVSPPAIEVMNEKGIDLSGHRTRCLTQEIVDSATVIVVMSTSHVREMKSRFHEAQDKVFLLKSFSNHSLGENVRDPIGSSVYIYRMIRDEIDNILLDLILYLKSL